MATTASLEAQGDSIVTVIRRLKEENAAEHGYEARAIGSAARKNQQEHPERIVSRENQSEEEANVQNTEGDA